MPEGYIDVPAAIKMANDLLKQKASVLAKIDIVRTDLRNAVTLGATNAEQSKYVADTFPVRERKAKSKSTAAA